MVLNQLLIQGLSRILPSILAQHTHIFGALCPLVPIYSEGQSGGAFEASPISNKMWAQSVTLAHGLVCLNNTRHFGEYLVGFSPLTPSVYALTSSFALVSGV